MYFLLIVGGLDHKNSVACLIKQVYTTGYMLILQNPIWILLKACCALLGHVIVITHLKCFSVVFFLSFLDFIETQM